ncbi:MAG: hypothetical protein AAB403_01535 [Planctomycetota bacterium]
MSAFCIEKAGAMENEDSQHGYDPQPIDIVPSFFHRLVPDKQEEFISAARE